MSASKVRHGRTACPSCKSKRFAVDDGIIYCADCDEPWEDEDVIEDEDDEDDEDEELEDEEALCRLMNSPEYLTN